MFWWNIAGIRRIFKPAAGSQIRSAAELRAEKWLELAGCGDIKPEIVVRYLERKELSTEELNQLAVLCESLCQSRPGAELRFSEIRGYLVAKS